MILVVANISAVWSQNDGAVVSLEVSALEKAKEVYFGYIQNALQNVTIENAEFSDGFMHDNKFIIT